MYLVGSNSNVDAIGSRLELYGPWGIQTREVKAGQSYGIQNSLTQRFGTGTESHVDSLVIYWPNGNVSTIQDIRTNNYVFAHESGFTYAPESSSPYQVFLCHGDTSSMSAPHNMRVRWTDMDTSAVREVTQPGLYQYSVWLDSMWIRMPGIEFIFNHTEKKTIAHENSCFCEGDQLILTSSDNSPVLWSSGQSDSEITVDEGGVYNFKYTNFTSRRNMCSST